MPQIEEKATYERIEETKPKRRKREVSCKDYALGLVSKQNHSSGHLRKKLQRKKYKKEEIEETIEDLKRIDLIQDQQYAETYFENLKKYRNFGYYGIKKKLMDKSIENQYINTILNRFSIREELEIAERVLSKSSKNEYQKQANMLRSRGFRTETIQKALSLKNSQKA